jgi:hypothetical protein
MTIRLATIIAPAFQENFKRVLATRAVPARTGYWLAKLHKTCSEELALFDATRAKLFQKLGQPVEGQPGQVIIPPDKVPEFRSELDSLDHDVELGLPAELKLQLPETFTPEDWSDLIALDLFNPPE